MIKGFFKKLGLKLFRKKVSEEVRVNGKKILFKGLMTETHGEIPKKARIFLLEKAGSTTPFYFYKKEEKFILDLRMVSSEFREKKEIEALMNSIGLGRYLKKKNFYYFDELRLNKFNK